MGNPPGVVAEAAASGGGGGLNRPRVARPPVDASRPPAVWSAVPSRGRRMPEVSLLPTCWPGYQVDPILSVPAAPPEETPWNDGSFRGSEGAQCATKGSAC
mmetsp:Transcript_178248/g.571395  ORF Transcript_178248/g.571395 Transcript_178248/m.571395 type:complete len:101 (-) Transcript_178248:192-494(-)